jgi:hypothetical protein
MEEAETVQSPKLKYITKLNPACKIYSTHWKSLCMMNGTRARLAIRRQLIKNSPDCSPSGHSERHTDKTTRWTIRNSLGCQQNLNKILQKYYWLQVRNGTDNWFGQCDACAAIAAPNQESMPKASVQR